MRDKSPLIVIVSIIMTLSACGSDDTNNSSSNGSSADAGASAVDAGASATDAGDNRPSISYQLALAGVWESAFGGNETISDSTWETPYGTSTVEKFNNDERWMITQNAADLKDNPSKFNRVLWTEPKSVTKDGFTHTMTYVCTVAYGLDSLELAEGSTQTADDSDPAKSGCGGFGWTGLSTIETEGTWKTNFGGVEIINRQAWSKSWLRGFVNKDRVAFTQNPEDAEYAPGRFNRLQWTANSAGKWYYCTTDFDLESLQAAKDSTKTADDSDPAKSGCGGFAWTEMTP